LSQYSEERALLTLRDLYNLTTKIAREQLQEQHLIQALLDALQASKKGQSMI
jgi:hypothetical protein